MIFKKSFPHYKQLDMMDCGPTCLRMIAKFYGKNYSLAELRELTYKNKEGVSLLAISDAAEKIGFHTFATRTNFDMLKERQPLPCIAHWNNNHFVVIYKIRANKVYLSDPSSSKQLVYNKTEFCKYWATSTTADGEHEGMLLLLQTTPDFYQLENKCSQSLQSQSAFLWGYLKPHKRLFVQLFIGMLLGSLVALALPLTTQAMVDFGINNQDINFVYVILFAQIMLYIGATSIELIRSWLLLHISTRMNISIVADFLSKLMMLPIAFFDSKNLGDVLQRIRDNRRVTNFLSSSSLQVIFSFFILLIYSFLLLSYAPALFLIFVAGTTLYVTWVVAFLKRRATIDHKRFQEMAANRSNEVQLVQGMQEIKLHNGEKQKRWAWEAIQIKLFRIGMQSLALQQYQGTGGNFINQIKNLLLTFWAAREVIEGNMSLGMMMAVTQILGQMDAPIVQFIHFLQVGQDAKLSLERIKEIHNHTPEDADINTSQQRQPEHGDLILNRVSFRYGDQHSPYILDDISLVIPKGKTTAIVGESGSGKTTLLKLLLKFYKPEKGQIALANIPLEQLNSQAWRKACGTVMQDGFIFSDTIARNIAVGEECIDKTQLIQAAKIANIHEYIAKLPLHYNTKIGADGSELSVGQKQRIRIARALYNNPDYLFFDEATSSLDTKNEKIITDQLNQYLKEKTAIVIAHRLSTVKNADNIIVLDKGKLVEQGNHQELTHLRGHYYELVKNQLELGM